VGKKRSGNKSQGLSRAETEQQLREEADTLELPNPDFERRFEEHAKA